MRYKQTTEYLGIPVLGLGDRISPEVELRKYQIIENMLIAGTQGVKDVVFDDGDFVVDEGWESVSVRLLANGAVPAAHGLVGGFYFYASSEIKWDGLSQGYLHYLYLEATSDLPHNRQAFRPVVYESQPSQRGLLMATIDMRESNPKLEPYPTGKAYSLDIARHCTDSNNPHGKSFTQDELTVNRLILAGEVVAGGKVLSIEDFAAQTSLMAGRRVEKFDFMSGGPDGVVLKASAGIFSVQVSRRSVGALTGLVGEVAIGYFGEDSEVDEENEFCVRNTGEAGVPMRAIVICG